MARKQKRSAGKRRAAAKATVGKKVKAPKGAAKKGKGKGKGKAAVTKGRKLHAPPPLTRVAKYGWYGPAW